MTRDEAVIKAPGLMIPQPFAAGDADHQAAFKPIDNEPLTNDVNFVEGFTPAFSAPGSQGGRYVTRQELNAVGHLASVNEFRRQVGGIVTFNPILAEKIGGYPMGAVLEYLDGLNYYRVISRVDNNMVNFNEVGVDGTNWAYCERGIVSEDVSGIVETGLVLPGGLVFPENSGAYVSPMSFRAQKTGLLNAVGAVDVTITSPSELLAGFGLAAHVTESGGSSSQSPDDVQYLQFYSYGSWGWNVTGKNIQYGDGWYRPCFVEKGQIYTIYVIGMGLTINSSDLKIVIV